MAELTSTQTLKLTQFNKNQKETAQSIARSIAQASNDMAAAIQHQVYARKNPDTVVDAGLLALMGASVDQLMAQYDAVDEMKKDIVAVKDGTMTAEELHTKYPFDLDAYALALV